MILFWRTPIKPSVILSARFARTKDLNRRILSRSLPLSLFSILQFRFSARVPHPLVCKGAGFDFSFLSKNESMSSRAQRGITLPVFGGSF